MSGFSRCMFPGSPVFRFIQRLSRITKEANEYIDQVKHQRGWLTDYNIRHNFSSVLRVSGILDEESRILMSVTNLAKSAVDAMYDVYDHVRRLFMFILFIPCVPILTKNFPLISVDDW